MVLEICRPPVSAGLRNAIEWLNDAHNGVRGVLAGDLGWKPCEDGALKSRYRLSIGLRDIPQPNCHAMVLDKGGC